jgi:Predicted O-methyltransferase
MDHLIKDGERIDEIGFGNLRLIQKPEDFCYGIDAVLLATFADIKENAKVADLGTGTGIIPIILSHKTKAEMILGVEVQEDSYERGLRNLSLNGLERRIKLVCSDVKHIITDGFAIPNSFDTVLTNPPYMKGDGGLKNKGSAKTIARHETTASLTDFINTAAGLLKDRGDFYMVHRPSRLVDICCLCRSNKLEPKVLRLVSPNKNTKPNILLIHCVKNGRPELKFLDPLFVYDENGDYTSEIITLYERK